MPLQTATLDVQHLLEVRHQSVNDFGVERIVEAVRRELAVHNGLMVEMVSALCRLTTDAHVTEGAGTDGEMIEADEYARVPTQATEGAQERALPIRGFQFAVGWTNEAMNRMTPADLATALLGAEAAHRRRVTRDVRAALLNPVNYSFTDYLGVDKNRTITVRALVNGDGQFLRMGQYGKTFDAYAHTHYDALDFTTAPAQQRGAALKALVEDVVEHDHVARPTLVIHRADEDMVKTAEGFIALADPRLALPVAGEARETLDVVDLDNRSIGYIGAAEVVVRPWATPGYAVAYAAGVPEADRPLAFRQEGPTSLQGLRLAGEIDAYPLQTRFLKANHGVAVNKRTNGAVLYLRGSVYVVPSAAVLG